MRKKLHGYTMMELLIVIAVIAIIATILIILLNPVKQMDKTWDVQRKHDLDILSKVIEDYYNDNSQYPTESDICYPSSFKQEGEICSCYICGKEANSPTFSPYLSYLPCDPQHSGKKYLYQYDCVDKSWYIIYALINFEDYFHYAIGSPNVNPYSNVPTITIATSPTASPAQPTSSPSSPTPSSIPSPTSSYCPHDPTPKFCKKNNVCNICSRFNNCLQSIACDQPPQLFSDFYCHAECSIP